MRHLGTVLKEKLWKCAAWNCREDACHLIETAWQWGQFEWRIIWYGTLNNLKSLHGYPWRPDLELRWLENDTVESLWRTTYVTGRLLQLPQVNILFGGDLWKDFPIPFVRTVSTLQEITSVEFLLCWAILSTICSVTFPDTRLLFDIPPKFWIFLRVSFIFLLSREFSMIRL